MSYTEVGIVNLALGDIGVKKVTSSDNTVENLIENSPQAIAVKTFWEYIRDEVLEQKEWKFAKKRQALGKIEETPASGYDYAYLMPDDFLKLCKGTEDDPGIYPAGYPYKIETMPVIAGIGGIIEFNPTSAYSANNKIKIGRYCEIDVGSSKKLYITGTYKQADITFIEIECESNTTDSLSVTASGNLITIKLANATGAKNTAALIQAAIRALSTVNDVDVTAWTVTQNAAYLAAYPTTGIDISAVPMGNGDKVYNCLATVTGSAANTSLFPAIETTYWEEVLPSEKLVLVTDYDNVTADEELIITYIRRVTDPSIFSPTFISALAFRLAAQLAIRLTEGITKFKGMMELYFMFLEKAEEINQSLDYFDTVDSWKEKSETKWVEAGRG
jgi:hypothetical protein